MSCIIKYFFTFIVYFLYMVPCSRYAFKTYNRLSMIISKIILKAKEKREISNLISDTVCMRGRVWRVCMCVKERWREREKAKAT